MKKFMFIAVAIFVIMFFSGVASAVNKTNCGCGLGTLLWQDHDALVSQTFAVTTNGTFGNQTFGITSGTLECDQPASYTSNEKVKTFVAGNMDSLARDIAQGQGEYLDALAALMELPNEKRAVIYSSLQKNFSNIYTSETIGHLEVISNIENVMAAI